MTITTTERSASASSRWASRSAARTGRFLQVGRLVDLVAQLRGLEHEGSRALVGRYQGTLITTTRRAAKPRASRPSIGMPAPTPTRCSSSWRVASLRPKKWCADRHGWCVHGEPGQRKRRTTAAPEDAMMIPSEAEVKRLRSAPPPPPRPTTAAVDMVVKVTTAAVEPAPSPGDGGGGYDCGRASSTAASPGRGVEPHGEQGCRAGREHRPEKRNVNCGFDPP